MIGLIPPPPCALDGAGCDFPAWFTYGGLAVCALAMAVLVAAMAWWVHEDRRDRKARR